MKKRTTVLTTTLIACVIAMIILYIFIDATNEKEILIDGDTLKIPGMFGTEIKLNEVQDVQLLEKIPKILFKINGASIGKISLGVFKVEGVEKAHLMLMDNKTPPFAFIRTKTHHYYLNSEDKEKTNQTFSRIISWFSTKPEEIP